MAATGIWHQFKYVNTYWASSKWPVEQRIYQE